MFAQLTHATYLEPTYVPTTMRQHTPNLFPAGMRDGGCVAALYVTSMYIFARVPLRARELAYGLQRLHPRGFDRSAEEGCSTAGMEGKCRRVGCKFARK